MADPIARGADHPAVAAVLAETPNLDRAHGKHAVDFQGNLYDAAPIAARQAAAALRVGLHAIEERGEQHCGCGCGCVRVLDALADEIDGGGIDG